MDTFDLEEKLGTITDKRFKSNEELINATNYTPGTTFLFLYLFVRCIILLFIVTVNNWRRGFSDHLSSR